MEQQMMDAYVFSGSGKAETRDAMADLVGKNVVRASVKLYTGEWTLLAFVEGADVQGLEGKIEQVRAIGNPSTDTAKATSYGPKIPTRWMSKPYYRAYLRIRTIPGRAREVLDRLEEVIECPHASAVVQGTFDVFLELGADAPDELEERWIPVAQSVEGVVRVEVGLAYAP
jgi:hypothetical protein